LIQNFKENWTEAPAPMNLLGVIFMTMTDGIQHAESSALRTPWAGNPYYLQQVTKAAGFSKSDPENLAGILLVAVKK
jgi:hypothetical protein